VALLGQKEVQGQVAWLVLQGKRDLVVNQDPRALQETSSLFPVQAPQVQWAPLGTWDRQEIQAPKGTLVPRGILGHLVSQVLRDPKDLPEAQVTQDPRETLGIQGQQETLEEWVPWD